MINKEETNNCKHRERKRERERAKEKERETNNCKQRENLFHQYLVSWILDRVGTHLISNPV